jgi:hypothetical protein
LLTESRLFAAGLSGASGHLGIQIEVIDAVLDVLRVIQKVLEHVGRETYGLANSVSTAFVRKVKTSVTAPSRLTTVTGTRRGSKRRM